MLNLPCPLHAKWEHSRRKHLPQSGGLYLAKVTFSHPPDALWCGLPFRQKGGLFWPLQGTGWYWSVEIEAACRHLHAEIIAVHDVWIARRECDCHMFDWVNGIYEERQRLGSGTRGYPLKLGLNSLYGKTAQRCGRGPFRDAVSAGLITAATRAQLIEAVGQDPEAVVMLATDAVFSTRPLSLNIGQDLGQWEEKVWPDLFIAQPGVYFSPTKLRNSSELDGGVKSRGVKRSIVGEAAPRFEKAFADWFEQLSDPAASALILKERLIPSVPVSVRVFYGQRAALARGKSWLAGKWEDVTRQESFEWVTKRDPMRVVINDEGSLTTFSREQFPLMESEGYAPVDFDRLISLEDGEEIDENTLMEGMPDHVDFLP